jgi:chorismate mutase
MGLRAIRGATTVEADDREQVIRATAKLLQEMMERNNIKKAQLIDMIFTSTPDIRSEFPAAAAREIGISDIPLLCATEMNVIGAVAQCIRVLMHVDTEKDYSQLRHVYLEGASQLRTDLPE